ncbi:MAG: GDP-mannose 4,6-dehydratase [Nanobdellota archaeon]
MKILVTGAAGFIGSQTALALSKKGYSVIGVDNFNDYYDPKLKKSRQQLLKNSDIPIFEGDVSDYSFMESIIKDGNFNKIFHSAAQAGVRYSIDYPFTYEKSNILGTLTLLELSQKYGIKDFVLSSSSSVYGNNNELPFTENDRVDYPISIYAASKKSNEEMCYVYSHLYGLNCTCLRFFTVYGPWGRPDMALFKFTDRILRGKPIDVYNNGKMARDFTYIKDIVSGVICAIDNTFSFEVFNLARGESIPLMDFILALEDSLGKKSEKNMLPLQPGDVRETSADIRKAKDKLGYKPETSVKEGVASFVSWYKDYYGY